MSHAKENKEEQNLLFNENAMALFNASKNLTEYYEIHDLKHHLQIMFQRCMEVSPEEYERVGASFWQVFNFLDHVSANPELATFIELFEEERYAKTVQSA